MRIKRGVNKNKKRRKLLKAAKGSYRTYSRNKRRMLERVRHDNDYSFAHRKKRKGDFRTLWIKRINAALAEMDIKYSEFISKLKQTEIQLNRKVLAALALDNPDAFQAVVKEVK